MRILQSGIDSRAAKILARWKRLPELLVPDSQELADWAERSGQDELLDPKKGRWWRTQDEIDMAKVLSLIDNPHRVPPIATGRFQQGHAILEGHHRWLASWYNNELAPTKVVELPDD